MVLPFRSLLFFSLAHSSDTPSSRFLFFSSFTSDGRRTTTVTRQFSDLLVKYAGGFNKCSVSLKFRDET